MIRVEYRQAPRWSQEELESDRQQALAAFVAQRGKEGTAAYEAAFHEVRRLVAELFAGTGDLLDFRPEALGAQPHLVAAARFLAGPPISEDDLDTLAGARLKGKKMLDAPLAERVVAVVKAAWDPVRFPWTREGRRPSPSERRAAIDWTAGVWAVELMRTRRRTESSKKQEKRVAQLLQEVGLAEKRGTKAITTLDDLPRRSYARETLLGGIKCDLPVRLADGRILALECKVSNSATNSVKRLIREVGGKAKSWQALFGAQVITGAVLAGVYKLSNLVEAQESFGIAIFWEHRLEPLREFVSGE